MKARLWLGFAALAIIFSPFTALAQAPAQPGQIAPRPAVIDANADFSKPIQLSATGEFGASSLRSARVSHEPRDRSTVVWKISIATLLAASAFDAASSMGKQESNPLLRSSDGSFGGQGIAVKAGLAGVSLAPQIFLRNRKDLRRLFTVANFINTGVFTAVGVHNMGINPAR